MIPRSPVLRIGVGLGLAVVVAATYALLRESGALAMILDGERLRAWIATLGVLGPIAVVGLMTLAILVSPVPSAPIAVAAGAAYGHTWGTLYVLAGAEAGAIGAFGLARLLGRDVMQRWLGGRLEAGILGSQNGLAGVIFVSRLLPFVSFDLVSYAAGLTALSFWRFALATLAGIVPASFLLAHFGDEMASGEGDRIMTTVVALGAITLVPVVVKLVRDRVRGGRHGGSGGPVA